MATRGWGKARKAGGFIDPAPTKSTPVNPKPAFTRQALNTPKVHHMSATAINMPRTQRPPWQKLE